MPCNFIGPLYGVSKDMWQALAVAITFAEAQEFAPAKVGDDSGLFVMPI